MRPSDWEHYIRSCLRNSDRGRWLWGPYSWRSDHSRVLREITAAEAGAATQEVTATPAVDEVRVVATPAAVVTRVDTTFRVEDAATRVAAAISADDRIPAEAVTITAAEAILAEAADTTAAGENTVADEVTTAVEVTTAGEAIDITAETASSSATIAHPTYTAPVITTIRATATQPVTTISGATGITIRVAMLTRTATKRSS